MRAHGYDLRDYAEKNWATIGPQLTDKIFIWVGDMDNFYLNLAVYDMEEFFKLHPEAHARFEYGRPEKGHGWLPVAAGRLHSEDGRPDRRACACRLGHEELAVLMGGRGFAL